MALTLLPRLPDKPKKTYSPSPKRVRAMTIAAGFQCADGYVLCADSLMSHGSAGEVGSFGSYRQKVFWTWEEDSRQSIVCGAGDGVLLYPFSQAFFSNLEKNKTVAVEEVVEHTLQYGLIVSPAQTVEVLGIGENSLTQFLIDSLHNPNGNSAEEAIALAAFITAGAKKCVSDQFAGRAGKYCPQYCGGETTIALLSLWRSNPVVVNAQIVQQLETLFLSGGKQKLKDLMEDASKLIKPLFSS